ncbi:MAG TPA: TraM recognition domain-containing protein [Urbifossiella sp.]|nr:TraM recognition domain-containing protein [Urbifossiella sp.]
MVLGQTGSGKSSGPGRALLLSFLRAGLGGCILTSKPQDATEYQELASLAGREQDVRVVAPGGPFKLNILDYQYRAGGVRGGGLADTVVSLALEWLQARDRSRGQPADPFWIDSAKRLLTCAIDLLGLAGEPITFPGIARLISSAPNSSEEVKSAEWQRDSWLNELVSRAVGRADLSPAQKVDLAVGVEFWMHDYAVLDDKTRSGIRATTQSLTFPFERSMLADLFGGESNCFPEDCYRRGAIIILDLPVKEFLEAGAAAQVLFKTVWQRAMERRSVAREPLPVFLFIDEYQNYVTSYDPLFQATARSSRVATVVMTQNLDSLISRFPAATGKAEAQALLGNFNLKVFCANDHVGTNEWAAKLIGEEWVTRQNVSASLGAEGQLSAGTTEQRRFLVDPLTFSRLLKGGRENKGRVQALCFRSGRPFADGRNHAVVNFNQNLA